MAQILSVSHTVITNRLFFFFFLFFFYWSLVDLQCCVSFPFFYEVLEVSTQTKVEKKGQKLEERRRSMKKWKSNLLKV